MISVKVLEKSHILRERKTEYVMREREVLRILGNSCNYFVHLYSTFQDRERLYFVLTYAKNGELLKQINDLGCFNIDCARYYSSELLLALEYLHSNGIIHRDLKPENILFDENWHIIITDFGSAKIVQEDTTNDSNNTTENNPNNRQKRNSFVGTAQYVSPEMLNHTSSSYASDLWAYGCIIYQMISGSMPFRGGSEYLIFQKIIKLDYEFPEGFHHIAKDLVEKLLVLEPSGRLGSSDETPYRSIRTHDFFHGINWDDLGAPPKLSDQCDNISDLIIPDDLEPGLDGEKLSKLQLDLITPSQSIQTPSRKKSEPNRKITDLTVSEINDRLDAQKANIYDRFVEGNLILKQGLVDKKKGLFQRRRMFLLTLGPHLYYVDPVSMELRGEIPWSADLKTEAKNFKIFFVHTVRFLINFPIKFVIDFCFVLFQPNRKYYLEDPEGYALEWCKAINEVKEFYYPGQAL